MHFNPVPIVVDNLGGDRQVQLTRNILSSAISCVSSAVLYGILYKVLQEEGHFLKVILVRDEPHGYVTAEQFSALAVMGDLCTSVPSVLGASTASEEQLVHCGALSHPCPVYHHDVTVLLPAVLYSLLQRLLLTHQSL